MIKRYLPLLLLPLLLSGCFLSREPYREAARYDFTPPEKTATELDRIVEVEAFRNLTPAGRNFLYRAADEQLFEEPDAAWSQMPEQMLRRYLAGYFVGGRQDGGAVYRISGMIRSFEFDAAAKEAVIGLSYEIREVRGGEPPRSRYGQCRHTAELKSGDAAAAAAAMSAAMLAAARDIAENLRGEYR